MKQYALLIALIIVISACEKSNNSQPQKTIDQPIIFNNVLILGNSITNAPANPSIGWNSDWGMAATVADSDYVHILATKFKKLNPNCKVTNSNISLFELDWTNYNLDANLHTFKDLNPDLIIFRIGENVIQTPLDTASFGAGYKALIKYFGTTPIILGVGSIWPRPVTDAVMAKYSAFFSLATIGSDYSVYSYGGLWSDPGIQQHPGNKGMRLIADSIWAHVALLKR